MKIPRQTQGESGGLEVPLSNLRRIKSAYGRSRSRTAEEGDRSNLDEQSKTSQGILVIFIAIVVAMAIVYHEKLSLKSSNKDNISFERAFHHHTNI